MKKISNNIVLNEVSDKKTKREKCILENLMQKQTQRVEQLEVIKQKLEEKIAEGSISSKEFFQEKEILKGLNSILSCQMSILENIRQNYEKKFETNSNTIKNLEQENIILRDLNQSMHNTISKLNGTSKQKEKEFSQYSKDYKELKQEKIILDEVVKNEETKANSILKKYYLTITIAGVVLAAVMVPYSFFAMTLVVQEYQIENLDSLQTGHVRKNLKGDIIETSYPWKLVHGEVLYVNILNAEEYPDKAEIVSSAILSKESKEIDNSLVSTGLKGTYSTYYLGWVGALEAASDSPTKFFIPANIKVIDSTQGVGDITIKLASERNADGFDGYTYSIVNENQKQILKSDITIFDVEDRSIIELLTITRHEFGHALGLAHSSDSGDLMHDTIETHYPYISPCNLDTIRTLYDDENSGQVECLK